MRLPGGRTAYVAPHLIPEEQPLASVDDVFNAVVVRGNATGEVMFYGQGAGELPTASACVADVMEALQSSPRREEIGWEADPAGFEDPQALRPVLLPHRRQPQRRCCGLRPGGDPQRGRR